MVALNGINPAQTKANAMLDETLRLRAEISVSSVKNSLENILQSIQQSVTKHTNCLD